MSHLSVKDVFIVLISILLSLVEGAKCDYKDIMTKGIILFSINSIRSGGSYWFIANLLHENQSLVHGPVYLNGGEDIADRIDKDWVQVCLIGIYYRILDYVAILDSLDEVFLPASPSLFQFVKLDEVNNRGVNWETK